MIYGIDRFQTPLLSKAICPSWIVMVFTKVMYPCLLQGEDPPVMLVYDLHKYYRVLRGL